MIPFLLICAKIKRKKIINLEIKLKKKKEEMKMNVGKVGIYYLLIGKCVKKRYKLKKSIIL